MRFLTSITLLSVASLCCAQTTSPTPATNSANRAGADTARIESRTERIVVEDTLSRIDELRVGGETRSITVAPRGGMPVYQVEPTRGERSWKVLSF